MIGIFPLNNKERETLKDKTSEICKELHKIFPYCVIDCHLREDLLYQFNIDFSYLNVRIGINIYIDYKMILTGLPDLIAKFMYDRYIVSRIVRVKEDIKNEEDNNA